jgi:hypothetical protein
MAYETSYFRKLNVVLTVHFDVRCNKNQQKCTLLRYYFNLIIISSTGFEHPNVHPQEDWYIQEYPAHPAIDQTAYMDA